MALICWGSRWDGVFVLCQPSAIWNTNTEESADLVCFHCWVWSTIDWAEYLAYTLQHSSCLLSDNSGWYEYMPKVFKQHKTQSSILSVISLMDWCRLRWPGYGQSAEEVVVSSKDSLSGRRRYWWHLHSCTARREYSRTCRLWLQLTTVVDTL